jgi:hypothetical protein
MQKKKGEVNRSGYHLTLNPSPGGEGLSSIAKAMVAIAPGIRMSMIHDVSSPSGEAEKVKKVRCTRRRVR